MKREHDNPEAYTPIKKFFKGNKDEADVRWEECREEPKTMWHAVIGDVPNTNKIASFDMDGTLITTKSGKQFATGRHDWQWLFPCVPKTLKQIYDKGFKIVIFTNQNGIKNGKTKLRDIQGKIQDILQQANVGGLAFIASGKDRWRKPASDVWHYMCRYCNGSAAVSKTHSFFIGDAAGRNAFYCAAIEDHRNTDFSCSDRKFAANIPVDFQTPEEFFFNAPPQKFEWRSINPKDFMKVKGPAFKDTPPLISDEQEILVCVGFPGCGKTRFSKKRLLPNGYGWVNQDTLKTAPKCHKECERLLGEGKSVVIDNTNVSKDIRAHYIAIAKKHRVGIRALLFKSSFYLCQHMNIVRELMSNGKQKRVPEIAYNMMKSKWQNPTVSEGFSEVKEIEFVPDFDDERSKQLFYQFTS
eukprot:TRINITY_DN66742_c5_g6_i1.p1 TRINITY_DN66742_c5_g6~~TRINITY_DN66742_c5_g6_i1.p1  ORF type:complete len:412 (-),score=16.36 TRINITY_DN66742_c5_g6_i1:134-1369(-)